jgi:hypothetical protein
MALFSDKELLKAMEDATKEKLRKGGIHSVRVNITGSVKSPVINFHGLASDVERAKKIIAG